MDQNTKYITCNCSYPPCMIAVSCWSDDPDELYVFAQMNHYLPWYKRIKYAFLYSLGRPVDGCHFTEVLTSKKALVEVLNNIPVESSTKGKG